MANEITEITRRAIIDYLVAAKVNWAGRLDEPAFLGRLYDLAKMPSNDPRKSDAAGDIYQHRVNWSDWENDWVFFDSRFDLFRSPDEEFLRFLCETVHPAVRPDAGEARGLAGSYNEELTKDGWELVEVKQISGRPVFAARRGDQRLQVFEEPTGWQKVDRQMQEIRLRLETADAEEAFQTVGLLCREALISVAQEVFDPTRHPTDGVNVSDTDAKRMIEAVFNVELAGHSNDQARRHARAAVDLSVALQHKRTADFRSAALCAEAAASTINLLAILAGRRGRGA